MTAHEKPQNSEINWLERMSGPGNLESLPGPARQGRLDSFLNSVAEEIAKLSETELVTRTWFTETVDAKRIGGILWVLGAEKAESKFSTTPHLIALPVGKSQSDKIKKCYSRETCKDDKEAFETIKSIATKELSKRLLSDTTYRENGKGARVPDQAMHMYWGGWCSEAFVWQEHVSDVIKKIDGMDEVDVDNQVFMMQSVMGGLKTAPNDEKSLTEDDISDQPMKALDAFWREVRKKEGGYVPENRDARNFWSKTLNFFGHSMEGFGLLRALDGRLKSVLEGAGNDYAKFHVMNEVVVGSSKEARLKASKDIKEMLSITRPVEGHVSLHESLQGLLVGQSGLLQSDVIRYLGARITIIPKLVKYFLGDMGKTIIPNLVHNYVIRHDPKHLKADNFMLKNVGLVLKSDQHIEYLRRLVGLDRMTFWIGSSDMIVTSEEEFLVAHILGAEEYIETVNHYASREIMADFTQMMFNFSRGNDSGYTQYGDQFPQLFKKLPDLRSVIAGIKLRDKWF